MTGPDLIRHHFPQITDEQYERFARLDALYRDWNAKINVISRRDIDNLYVNHVLHSLAIAKVIEFMPSSRILDLGTGGGFPGIPLAILFPEVHFHLVDSIRKKITVCKEVAAGLELANVSAEQARVEELKKGGYDFIVTRAVARMDTLRGWAMHLVSKSSRHDLPNGILALKGRGLEEEMAELPKGSDLREFSVAKLLPGQDTYESKSIVYVNQYNRGAN